MEFNKLGQKRRPQCPLPNLVFFGLITKQNWPIRQKGGTLYPGARYVAPWASCFQGSLGNESERGTNKSLREPLRDLFAPRSDSFPMNPPPPPPKKKKKHHFLNGFIDTWSNCWTLCIIWLLVMKSLLTILHAHILKACTCM